MQQRAAVRPSSLVLAAVPPTTAAVGLLLHAASCSVTRMERPLFPPEEPWARWQASILRAWTPRSRMSPLPPCATSTTPFTAPPVRRISSGRRREPIPTWSRFSMQTCKVLPRSSSGTATSMCKPSPAAVLQEVWEAEWQPFSAANCKWVSRLCSRL